MGFKQLMTFLGRSSVTTAPTLLVSTVIVWPRHQTNRSTAALSRQVASACGMDQMLQKPAVLIGANARLFFACRHPVVLVPLFVWRAAMRISQNCHMMVKLGTFT